MRTLIESLKRLYQSGKTTEKKIRQMHETGVITLEELEYIIE
ncbi:MAG: XkdX family protein [Bacillota bacterium]|nr:XkdX family protein [Bacillota bacterium]